MINMTSLRGVNKAATGRRIQQLIQIRGTNVTEVSKIMGLTYQCVYRWIKGETFPDIDNLVILSRILCVKLETILVLDDAKNDKEIAFKERMWAYYAGVRKYCVVAV